MSSSSLLFGLFMHDPANGDPLKLPMSCETYGRPALPSSAVNRASKVSIGQVAQVSPVKWIA